MASEEWAKRFMKIHPHMLRHACGFKLANDGVDTRTIQAYLGHKSIQHTVRYTELSPTRFKNLFRTEPWYSLPGMARIIAPLPCLFQIARTGALFPFTVRRPLVEMPAGTVIELDIAVLVSLPLA